MKSLEGGLNPDHLSSERHRYGGTFELDFIPLHFRRGIRHAGTGSHIELPTIVLDGVNSPIDVKDRECFAGLTTSTIP